MRAEPKVWWYLDPWYHHWAAELPILRATHFCISCYLKYFFYYLHHFKSGLTLALADKSIWMDPNISLQTVILRSGWIHTECVWYSALHSSQKYLLLLLFLFCCCCVCFCKFIWAKLSIIFGKQNLNALGNAPYGYFVDVKTATSTRVLMSDFSISFRQNSGTRIGKYISYSLFSSLRMSYTCFCPLWVHTTMQKKDEWL